MQRRQQPVTVVVSTPATPATQSSISSALARIIDQLNPTAWLPAAVLVGDVAIAVAYAQATGSPASRWREIGNMLDKKPLGVLLGVLFALCLVTILTQTLGFTAIRLLEGYWGASKPASWLASIGIWWHEKRQRRLINLGDRLDRRALIAVLPVLKREFSAEPLVATAIDWRINGLDVSAIDAASIKKADDYLDSSAWLGFVPARLGHRISAVDELLTRFPTPDRMMPTRLGLELRVPEDKLKGPQHDGDLRGYVIRNLAEVDPLLLGEHDEHRNRLDMYAVMTLTALALVPINILLLHDVVGHTWMRLLVIAAVLLALTSYRGAIAAAGEYGEALKAIDRSLNAGSRSPRA